MNQLLSSDPPDFRTWTNANLCFRLIVHVPRRKRALSISMKCKCPRNAISEANDGNSQLWDSVGVNVEYRTWHFESFFVTSICGTISFVGSKEERESERKEKIKQRKEKFM